MMLQWIVQTQFMYRHSEEYIYWLHCSHHVVSWFSSCEETKAPYPVPVQYSQHPDNLTVWFFLTHSSNQAFLLPRGFLTNIFCVILAHPVYHSTWSHEFKKCVIFQRLQHVPLLLFLSHKFRDFYGKQLTDFFPLFKLLLYGVP